MASTPNLNAASLFRVDGMVAVISGGGTGIGLIMARALVTNGAKRVYLLGRRREVLDAAAQENNAFIPIQCDVTSKSSLQSAVDKIAADAGYINLLLANSGVVGPTVGWRPDLTVSEIRAQLFDQAKMDGMTETMNVNVTGAFYTLVAFLELLEAGNQMALKGKGFGAPIEAGSDVLSVQSQVIITSSISAFSRAAMSPPAYAASKAAILHLTKHASSNLAHHGIRVNALAPGLFPSDLAQGLMGNREPSKETPDDPRYIPARRFGGDEEMAGTILYLAGRPGAYCNGSVLMADGGRLAVMPSSY